MVIVFIIQGLVKVVQAKLQLSMFSQSYCKQEYRFL